VVVLGAGVGAFLVGLGQAVASKGTHRVTAVANEIKAMARILASEAGGPRYTEDVREYIAWTARNRARKSFKGSIWLMETGGIPENWRAQSGSNPPFSSAVPPTERDYATARKVLGMLPTEDPTGGATQILEPEAQDHYYSLRQLYLHGGGHEDDKVPTGKYPKLFKVLGYKRTADMVREKWAREHGTLVASLGRFEFWTG